MEFSASRDHAEDLDASDILAPYRDQFFVPDADLIYLDGNSLGRPTRETLKNLDHITREVWGRSLIRGWNEDWLDAPQRLGAKIARLIGAKDDEVIVCDSTSVNLFKLVLTALRMQRGRSKIITDDLNFPSDHYILQGTLDVCPNHTLQCMPSPDGINGPQQAIVAAMDDETALVTLSHASFKSAFLYDMGLVGQAARDNGAWVLWDLSHSVGTAPIHLNACEVEMAVGCTYKYLNGGPGSPAFLYVRRDLIEKLHNPIPGWLGHRSPFEFDPNYGEATGIRKFLTGTPPILSLLAIEKAADLVLEAGIPRIRAKSIEQTEYLIGLWREVLRPLEFKLNSPSSSANRGSHISFGHAEAYRICRALIEEKKVLPDFRGPDNIRFGISTLYTRFVDIYDAVTRLRDVVDERSYEKYSAEPEGVT